MQKTLWAFLSLLQRCSQCILQPEPTGSSAIYLHTVKWSNSSFQEIPFRIRTLFFYLHTVKCKNSYISNNSVYFCLTHRQGVINPCQSGPGSDCNKGVNTLSSDIFSSSIISRKFNLRSTKTSLWDFLVFSGTTAEFKCSECSASFVSIWPWLKSESYNLILVTEGAESK